MKVPEPRKLKSGNYRIQLRLDGESYSFTEATPEECRSAARLFKAEYLAGRRTAKQAGRNKTLKQVTDDYIEKHGPVLSPSTLRVYKIFSKQRFKTYQDTLLKDLDVQQMINDELKKDVSEKTVKNAWGLTRAAMAAAGVEIPPVKLAKVPVNEIAFLQPEEITKFCKEIKGKTYEIAALLMLHGLRVSEVLGLNWNNVNLKRGVLGIRGAVVDGPDGKLVEKKTNKNETSTRTVPVMIPQLSDALKAVPEEKREGPVVTLSQDALLGDVKRASERAGVTVVTCHGLRHSFASLCYHLQIPERQIMQWGGWADYQTMHKIYIRLAASDESKARDAVTAFFAGKNAHKNAHKAKKNK